MQMNSHYLPKLQWQHYTEAGILQTAESGTSKT